MNLKKTSMKYLIRHFTVKQWKMYVIALENYQKYDDEESFKQQSELNFNGIHKS